MRHCRHCKIAVFILISSLCLSACSLAEGISGSGVSPAVESQNEFRPTDPNTVSLHAGRPQLVEVYSRY